MNKIDYKLKSMLLNSGLIPIANTIKRGEYLIHNYANNPNTIIPKKCDIDYLHETYFNDNYEFDAYNECCKIINATCKRNKRLRERIILMLQKGTCYFVTLTFSDDVLKNTTKIARRERVNDFLNQYYNEHIANIDYGFHNNREHYHAICLFKDYFDYTKWYNPTYRSGFNAELITISNACNDKLSKYINKLVNHAIKETTKRNAIIYSEPYEKYYTENRKLIKRMQKALKIGFKNFC